MKPTFSIIFFTVISGAGLGLLSLLSLADLFPGEMFPRRALTSGIAAAFALISVGLASSVLHLAKPSNAWRAFSRFRTSWLSREAVLSASLVAATLLYGAIAAFTTAGDALRLPVAAIVWVLCIAVLFCTAMIYTSLKPIRQWHTRWTPACYLLLGHWSGALLLLALAIAFGAAAAAYAWLAAAIGIAALVAKLGYWRAIAADPGALTLERAIGVREGVRPPGMSIAQARLFDLGHTHGTFLTHEFGFTIARKHARALRALSLALVFAVPALAWIAGARSAGAVSLLALLCIFGLLAERWLFFAEARHTVRLYHGDART
ncbi:MAG: DmsC/YnfH family molybdoenzyme membrane anchor subunit [Betaproteobacteria bacterium]